MTVSNKPAVETLFLQTFDRLVIRLGATAKPLQFETRTVEALLIYVACQGRAVGRDLLAELLWPERSQEQARSNLRVALHRLRRQLDPYLLITRHSVAINPDAAIVLECSQFEAHLAAGRLTEATALYTGDFLADFYLDGSPAFEQWLLLERERLRTLAVAAYQQQIGQLVAQSAYDTAIAAGQRLLHLDPLHEPTRRQLMRLLAQVGQRSAALAQYESCRQLLQRELGAPPDEATTTLAEQIRQGELRITNYELRASTTTEQTFVTHNSELVTRHNLPPQPTPFIGRGTELAQIAQALANPDCRLLTLLGMGGMGKSRIALETAARQIDNFADGICFVSLAGVGSADLVPTVIAQSLGIQTTSRDLLAQVAAYLRPRQLLLVLDNFEHLLAAGDTVAYLLQHAPRLKVLVTARQRLDLREEWLWPVTGLSLAAGLPDEAGELFLRSAQRVHPDFALNGQEVVISTICRQVEGMPLALELAASWLRIMSCAEIARQMQANLDFLSTKSRNQPERHRSIRVLFDQSWRVLTPVEQGVFMRLSVFQGGWRLDEAIVVTGATSELLLGLVDQSLVRLNGQNRFTMHELVRQYAAEQLATQGETDLINQRHYATYLQLARRADGKLRGPAATEWFARLDDEQANLYAALQWTLTTERFADAAWLGIALSHYWNNRGQWVEGAKWLEQLLPHRQAIEPTLRLATLLTLYSLWRAYEEFQSIDHYWGELMALEEVCTDKLLRATTWYLAAVAMTDAPQAVAACERSIALARAAGATQERRDEFGVFADQIHLLATVLFRYAIRLIDIGEYAQAERLSSESLTLFQSQGNRDLIAFALGNLGRLALLRGEIAQAHTRFHAAVAIAVAVDNQMTLSNWQPLLGITTLYCGETAEAEHILLASLHLARDQKNDFVLARVYTYLAETALWQGDLNKVTHWLTHAFVHHANPRWIKSDLVDCLWVAARLATVQQQYYRSATLFGLAAQVRSRIGYPLVEPTRPLVDAALATVQAALEPAAFAAAFAAGQQMTLAEAFVALPVLPIQL